MKSIHFLFALLITASLFQSCQKEALDNDVVARQAPALPTAQSFIMPLEDFETDSLSESVGPRTGAKGNFVFSALNVLVWNSVVTVGMAVPVASFAEAFNHEAVFVGNNTFEWRYNFRAEGRVHTATLTAEVLDPDTEEVAWTMTISRNGGFQNFVYYTGVTNQDRTASWTLNHQPNNPETLLQIDYTASSDDEFGIRYTNIRPAHPDSGDFIEHRAQPTGDFNRFYDVFIAKEDNLLNIEWNKPNGNGRVKNEKHFTDDAWHCWDTNQDDIDCQ